LSRDHRIRTHRRARGLVAAIGAAALASLAIAGPAAAQSSGDVNVSGSSTVEPITSLVAELYSGKNPDVSVRVDGPGTGDGFKLFCNDETDISDASRPIKPEEAAACQAKAITYTELPIGLDGLTVIVNKNSSLKLKCLSQADLYALFGPESTGDLSTDSALATQLGTKQGLPSTGTVKKFTPGPESGTYDAFIELGYQKIMDAQLAAGKITDVTTDDKGKTVPAEPLISDGQFPNDNDIVKRVEGSKNGIGFLGIAYYSENQSELKAVAIEDPTTGKCVKPTEKTVQNGTYLPLSRTLFIYVNNAKAGSNASVKSFVDFYMTKKNLTKSVIEAGYAPLPPAKITESISTWKAAE